jgi:glycosyltransferase involved in cell wall biosynthesis
VTKRIVMLGGGTGGTIWDSESGEWRPPKRPELGPVTDKGQTELPRWAERRSTTRLPPHVVTVSLVIPTKNEALNLATVLNHVPDSVSEVILVDGLSSDVTEKMATLCYPDARIIEVPTPGKGNALRAGFAAARGDIIVAMDADGSMSPTEIPNLLYFLEHGFDFVKGSRFMVGGGSLDITPIRRAGNRALVGLANRLYRTQLTDLCYGLFAFRRAFLDDLDLRSTGFEIETEITARAVLIGLRVTEAPSMELPRRTGTSNLRTFRDGARVLQTLFHERARAKLELGGKTKASRGGIGTPENQAQGADS